MYSKRDSEVSSIRFVINAMDKGEWNYNERLIETLFNLFFNNTRNNRVSFLD